MASSLPNRVDPRRLGRNAERLAGDLPAGLFQRLGAVLVPSDETVEVELQFGCLDHGIPFIEGVATLAGAVECQRCLEPMSMQLSAEIRIAVLQAGERPPSDAGYEPLELGEPELSISRLVEDELLLALPDYPVHQARCQVADISFLDADEGGEEQSESPFAVLASLTGLEKNER